MNEYAHRARINKAMLLVDTILRDEPDGVDCDALATAVDTWDDQRWEAVRVRAGVNRASGSTKRKPVPVSDDTKELVVATLRARAKNHVPDDELFDAF